MTGAGDLSLPADVMAQMLPMHLVISSAGTIDQAGPTLTKLFPDGACLSKPFLDLFELRRPRDVTSVADLVSDQSGNAGRLMLRLRHQPETTLKGLAVPLPDGRILVNLSFGIAAVEAVGRFSLSSGDFAHTDLTVEMLYLVEAKEAVMSESRRLNMRLEGQRLEAEKQAYTDTLTGLKNRRAMDVILDRHAACGERFSLMHIDLDHFKEVNDSLGHAAGDHVLQVAARILQEVTRDSDAVCRYGGDEFVIILNNLVDKKKLGALAERLIERLSVPIEFDGRVCKIAGSIGIARSVDFPGADAQEMLRNSDLALYASKNAGRGRFSFADTETPDAQSEAAA